MAIDVSQNKEISRGEKESVLLFLGEEQIAGA